MDHLLVTEVSVPIPGIICFSKGSLKGISFVLEDSIGSQRKYLVPRRELFVSQKTVLVSQRELVKSV